MGSDGQVCVFSPLFILQVLQDFQLVNNYGEASGENWCHSVSMIIYSQSSERLIFWKVIAEEYGLYHENITKILISKV